ncbi:AAA family ATPase [Shewanella oncorhynchi]|uniref:AAA family ATPase n=1 Tax=Shewanella oncorhynchi TaxID=2726434 RepID=UPI003D78EDC9
MIKKFGFRNFSSFKDGAEINFSFRDDCIDEEDLTGNISTVIGIKGANGSGKTNILKALTFLYCFCSKRVGKTSNQNSANKKEPEIEIPVTTFSGNGDVAEFYIEFIRRGVTYYYELDVKSTGIVREEIRRKIKKEVVCLIREGNKIIFNLKEFDELKKLRLKPDQSIISVVEDFVFHEAMYDLDIMNWNFTRILFNVGYDGYKSPDQNDYFFVSEFYFRNEKAFELVKEIIKSVDNGIVDIIIEKTTDSESGDDIYFPTFLHNNGEKQFSVGLSHESMGTKALFLTLNQYWLALKDGSLLVLDEFDTHLHSMILPEIIELFTNKKINKNNAQLILTAHNTEIIDSLGRCRTILVNKDNNESYCYRLDDIPLLRNDRLISPLYRKGRIGGTPSKIEGLASRLAEEWNFDFND